MSILSELKCCFYNFSSGLMPCEALSIIIAIDTQKQQYINSNGLEVFDCDSTSTNTINWLWVARFKLIEMLHHLQRFFSCLLIRSTRWSIRAFYIELYSTSDSGIYGPKLDWKQIGPMDHAYFPRNVHFSTDAPWLLDKLNSKRKRCGVETTDIRNILANSTTK